MHASEDPWHTLLAWLLVFILPKAQASTLSPVLGIIIVPSLLLIWRARRCSLGNSVGQKSCWSLLSLSIYLPDKDTFLQDMGLSRTLLELEMPETSFLQSQVPEELPPSPFSPRPVLLWPLWMLASWHTWRWRREKAGPARSLQRTRYSHASQWQLGLSTHHSPTSLSKFPGNQGWLEHKLCWKKA